MTPSATPEPSAPRPADAPAAATLPVAAGPATANPAAPQPGPRPLWRDLGTWVLAGNGLLLAAFLIWLVWLAWRPEYKALKTLIGDLAFIAFMASMTFMTWRASGTPGLSRRTRTGWRLIALGGGVYLFGNAVWTHYEVILGIAAPSPSLADLGFVGFYPPVLAGIACFLRPVGDWTERTLFWLDLGVVAIGAGTLIWYFLLWPIALADHESALALVLAEVYPLSAAVLLVAATALLFKPWDDRATAPIAWLVMGLFAYFVADTLYAYASAAKTYASGGLYDIPYQLSALLIMTSAFLESRGSPRTGPPAGGRPAVAGRILALLPYVATAVVYGLLLRVTLGGAPEPLLGTGRVPVSGLVLAAVVIAALVMARQSVAAREIARLQAERATRASETRFVSLVRHSSDLIALVGPDLHLRFVSPAVERILGLAAADLTERPLADLIHPEDRPAAAAFMARVLAQGGLAARIEWRVGHADGTWRYIENLATNLIDDPAVAGVVINGRDITDRKHFEQEVQEARLAAEAASRAKTEFLALMSHEIRTPLNGVLGLAQVLERGPLAPGQRDMVERIRSAGRSLLAIINDILDLSKLEAGRMQVESGGFELGPLLTRIENLMAPAARDKGLDLHLEAPAAALGPVLGDAQRLEQVLANVVGNAIKFTERGEVGLRVEAHAGAPMRVRFEVRDTGIGIAPATLARLFTPFTQADEGITRRFGGIGLGLALSKRLVELMGGSIGVESEPGRGSTFWFELPLEPVTTEGLAVAGPPPAVASPPASAAAQPAGATAVEPGAVVPGARLEVPGPAPVCASGFPPALAEERLAALRKALRGHELRTLSLASDLEPILCGTLGEARSEAIRSAVRGLRFEEALALLERPATPP